MQSPHSFHVMAKPTGSLCNIQCDYCYFLDREKELKQPSSKLMSDETLERYIQSYIEAQPNDHVVFSWQGGEPTLLGLAYFEKIITLQKRHNPLGKTIHNDLQTNGILLNKQWCKFLKTHRFFVGLSIDGPSFIHDYYRHSRGGRPTLEKVKTAAQLLHKYNIPFATLTCVTSHSACHAIDIYQFLRDEIKSRQMQFIPIVDPEEIEQSRQYIITTKPTYSITPSSWGTFMKEIFDEWYSRDIGRIYVPFFEDCMAVLLGQPSSSCITSAECGRALAIMQDGSVYSCDHYIQTKHQLGSIKQLSLAEMASSERQIEYGKSKKSTLPPACKQCPYLRYCNGGCPKDRIAPSQDESPQNYLCSGLHAFYNHAIPQLKQLATKLYNH